MSNHGRYEKGSVELKWLVSYCDDDDEDLASRKANARGIKTFIDKKYSSLISATPRKEHVLGFYGYKKETFDLKVDYKIETGDPYYEQYIKDRFDIIKDVYSSLSKEYFDIRNKKLKKIRKKR